MLAEDAIKSAIKDYQSKRARVQQPTIGPEAAAAATAVGPAMMS
jgi:hypothetical protein